MNISKLEQEVSNNLLISDFCSVTKDFDAKENYLRFDDSEQIGIPKLATYGFQKKPQQNFYIYGNTIDELENRINPSLAAAIAYNLSTPLLSKLAAIPPTVSWSKRIPPEVDLIEYINSFSAIVREVAFKLLDKTKRFLPHTLIVGSSVLPTVAMQSGFKAKVADTIPIMGIYEAGTLQLSEGLSVTVYVSPQMKNNEWALLVASDDKLVVPYALAYNLSIEEHDDEAMIIGEYDINELNTDLIVKGSCEFD